MKIVALASGSKGNCTLVSINGKNFLVDVGISFKTYKNRLVEANIYVNKIDGIFITHEHSDHVLGLVSFLKNTTSHIYLTRGTYEGLKVDVEKYASFGRFKLIEPLKRYNDNDEISISTFSTSHDAKDSLGYIFESSMFKLGYISDTGYLQEKYHTILKNLDAYYVEFNYDVDMLMNSSRPWPLKQRILADTGHLSNVQAANFLDKVIGKNTKVVILSHLSEECNSKDKALKALMDILPNNLNIQIVVAEQHRPSTVVEIRGGK